MTTKKSIGDFVFYREFDVKNSYQIFEVYGLIVSPGIIFPHKWRILCLSAPMQNEYHEESDDKLFTKEEWDSFTHYPRIT